MLTELSIQSVRDRALLLRSLPAFAPLEDEALSLLAEHMRLRHHRAGDVLLTLGDPIHHVYVVLEGAIAWRRKNRPEQVAGRQQVVGWLTLMARDADGLDAVAASDALTLELSADVLEHALEDDFGIVRNLLRLGASQLVAARGSLPAPADKPPSADVGIYRDRPRGLVERLISMREVPLFARCNVEALIALVRSNIDVRFEAGETVWRAGDASTFWLVIEYGCIRCTTAAGEPMDIGANFVLGIMDSIGQLPRSYTARAQTPVIAIRIDLEAFLGVLELHADLARDFLAFLAQSVLERS